MRLTMMVAIISLAAFTNVGLAQTLNNVQPQVSLSTAEQPLPAAGVSMNFVRQHFGEPQAANSPVGEPPIIRWDYNNFSVFFEHQHVIHSVLNHPIP